ncbi:hypothetical protein [Salinimonas chungwhensis]|uniref:hypothetical protein n=1 Tax=Salinimonas chungwhensis TaxID=265425 RepID=UPI000373F9B5|nr:hypothetical protein [Salinimonas chungwhensis]
MNKIISTCQADNWFFIHESNEDFNIFRVAVWATYYDGTTGGLVSVVSDDGKSLTPPPNVKGTYIHWDEMDEKQKGLAEKLGKITIDNLKKR